jgi:hypothetical protein
VRSGGEVVGAESAQLDGDLSNKVSEPQANSLSSFNTATICLRGID